jgi:hypothetical protein
MNDIKEGWVNVLDALKSMKPKRSVKELRDAIEKMRAVADYHTLTAGHWLKEIQIYEKMIEERIGEENEQR